MVGIVLPAMILSAAITAASSMGLPVDSTSLAFAVLIVAVVAGVIAAVLCLVIGRRS